MHKDIVMHFLMHTKSEKRPNFMTQRLLIKNYSQNLDSISKNTKLDRNFIILIH